MINFLTTPTKAARNGAETARKVNEALNKDGAGVSGMQVKAAATWSWT